MYETHYRYPENAKDGAYGMVILGYKGDLDYCFKGDEVITRELEECKIGGEVSFPDVCWGKKRTVTLIRKEESWDFRAEYEDGADILEPGILDKFSNQIFLKALAKANRVRYYNYDIHFSSVDNWQKCGCELKNGKIQVYLEDKHYQQVKSYYEAFQKLRRLENNEERDFRCQFAENFGSFISIRFSKRIKWKLQPWTKAVNKVLNPTINFSV